MIAHCFQRESEENEEYMQGSLTGEKKMGEVWRGVIYGISKIY